MDFSGGASSASSLSSVGAARSVRRPLPVSRSCCKSHFKLRPAIRGKLLCGSCYAAGLWVMKLADKTYIVRFKPPQLGIQLVAASSAQIHGEHIALLNSNGQ